MSKDTELSWEEKVKSLHCFRDRCHTFQLFREMAQETLMTNLAPRIHSLSKKFYSGCGFHYNMEQTLGYLLQALAICKDSHTINMNDYDDIPKDIGNWISYEVFFENLCEDVIRAEESAKELNKKHGRF